MSTFGFIVNMVSTIGWVGWAVYSLWRMNLNPFAWHLIDKMLLVVTVLSVLLIMWIGVTY